MTTGTNGPDTLIGTEFDDLLDGGAGADVLIGLAGNDIYVVDQTNDAVEETEGNGTDTVYASASYWLAAGQEIEILSVDGWRTGYAINLAGNAFANTLYGNDGVNILDGGAGADLMAGFAGNDVYVIDDGGDTIWEAAGNGTDTVYTSVNYGLTAGQEIEVLSVDGWRTTYRIDLSGNAFANTLYGNDGVNILDGGAGADLMAGFAGNDIYVIDNAGDTVWEAAGNGFDTVYASVSHALAAGQEVEVLSVDGWRTTYRIDLTGNAFANTLYGNDGVNILDGGAGADLMAGFAGNDIYVIDNAGDTVWEAAGNGSDTVYASVNYTLAAGQEIETLSVDGWRTSYAINLAGNAFANTLYGNDGVNLLDGGAGADLLAGFAGNDVYVVDDGGDTIYEGAGNGIDTVYASVTYTLAAGQEIETLSVDGWRTTYRIDLSGNAFANTLYGNDGVNILDGGAGADLMAGFAGNDIYIVDDGGDIVWEAAGNGNDTVYASASYRLTAGQEVELLSVDGWRTSYAIDLTGNELANSLYGNDGANILDGGAGADLLIGFAGADSFAFTTALGNGNVDVIQDFQPGTDRILLGGNPGEAFAVLAAGGLREQSFVIGSAARDADDFIIYDPTTGALFYDSDGSGAGAAIQFAALSAGTSLSSYDFDVSGGTNSTPILTSGDMVSVEEGAPTSTIVYQVTATDADGDAIIYSLAGTTDFAIDSTGAIRFVSSPNFEARPQYTFMVRAEDSAGAASFKWVTVNVIDKPSESTPVINEWAGENGSRGTGQIIPDDAFEVADNPNLPDDSLPSVTIKGDISSSSDVDFFTVYLEAGQLLILDVDAAGGNLDSFLRLFDPSVELVSNDDQNAFDTGSVPNAGLGHNTDSYIRFRASSSGTYYISIGSFQDPDRPTSGSYQLHVSIGPPVSAEQILLEDADALLDGARWNSLDLTYAFPNSYTDFPAGFGDGEATATSGYEAFNASQRTATTEMLNYIAQLTNLNFQLVSDPSGSSDGSADLTFAESNLPDVAYAYTPGGGPEGGSTWFNHTDFNSPVRGEYGWMGILHETGHALGLKHGHEGPAVSRIHDTLEYTVMTYRSYEGAAVGDGGGYTNETGGFPQTLMMLDIAALQKLYGADFTYNSGDTNYSWSPASGQMLINGTGQWIPSQNRVFMTVWDGGGNDTYDLSAYSETVRIDLRPGEWTLTSGVQLANLGDGHFARGNVANALLYNDDPRSLIENAIGGSGNDELVGNRAANQLTGRGGADRFTWYTADEIGRGPTSDTVTDFQAGQDKFDLAGVDAISGTQANDSFAFIGSAAFSNQAGQLRFQVEGNNLRVLGDVDGNGVADFDFVVLNTQSLSHTDFFL